MAALDVYWCRVQREAGFMLYELLFMCWCFCYLYLLDVAFNVERQVEEKLEALQDVERVACGVSFVFPAQDLLEKSICSITRS